MIIRSGSTCVGCVRSVERSSVSSSSSSPYPADRRKSASSPVVNVDRSNPSSPNTSRNAATQLVWESKIALALSSSWSFMPDPLLGILRGTSTFCQRRFVAFRAANTISDRLRNRLGFGRRPAPPERSRVRVRQELDSAAAGLGSPQPRPRSQVGGIYRDQFEGIHALHPSRVGQYHSAAKRAEPNRRLVASPVYCGSGSSLLRAVLVTAINSRLAAVAAFGRAKHHVGVGTEHWVVAVDCDRPDVVIRLAISRLTLWALGRVRLGDLLLRLAAGRPASLRRWVRLGDRLLRLAVRF